MNIDHVKLLKLANRIVTVGGSSPAEAAIVAEHLVEANLRGHDSHGVGMLVAYVRDLDNGTLKVNQTPEIVSDTGTISVWDARAGYGQVVARQAVEWAIEAARKHGVAVNGLRNAHHIGRVGTYGEIAARAGMVALHFVNVASGPPAVAPFRGREGRFLTNPVCIAIPGTDNNEPILLDFATSRVAHGKSEGRAQCRQADARRRVARPCGQAHDRPLRHVQRATRSGVAIRRAQGVRPGARVRTIGRGHCRFDQL